MEIIVGRNAGFCYGVKRAVEGAEKQIENNNTIYCLGEIVHNKQVVDGLKNKGLIFVDTIDEIINNNINNNSKKVIIRAHGVSKDIYLKARDDEIEIIDYTCPNVLRIHDIAEEYSKNGYFVFLIGMENHPEILGTKSYCGNNYKIISDEKNLERIMDDFYNANINKLLIISQTTFSLEKFNRITNRIKELLNDNIELIIKNTICLATEQRQKETARLSKEVEGMIIIGGKKSSNTKKLYEIANNNCKNAILIETKDELEKSKLAKLKKIGIMAGASTPQDSIDKVVEFCDGKLIKNTI